MLRYLFLFTFFVKIFVFKTMNIPQRGVAKDESLVVNTISKYTTNVTQKSVYHIGSLRGLRGP